MTMTTHPIDAPFPWFGGKRCVASIIWGRFGQPANYIEPFAGSLAVLLGRPGGAPSAGAETVNDLDGFIANFWRAVAADPDAVAHEADWPANENDLHARHAWLVEQRERLRARLEGDPAYYDARIAGWWVWGIASWIGGGWCSGNGPWQSVDVGDGDRQLIRARGEGRGVQRRRIHIGRGMGVNRRRAIVAWMRELSERLRRVRVASGDWARVCDSTATLRVTDGGVTGVFLDPPYSHAVRMSAIYTEESDIAADVLAWCRRWGQEPKIRIALCGYENEIHTELEHEGWAVEAWKAHGGYASLGDKRGRENAHRERIWFSPSCLSPAQGRLFG